MSTSLSTAPRCHRCGQRAPVVLRGLESRCTACGAPRLPFSAPSVSLAGQPSRVGGVAASIAGISVLVVGMSLAIGLLLLLQSIWPASAIGWAFGIPIFAVSLLVGLLLLVGGRRLQSHGKDRQRAVRLDAARALLSHRGGKVGSHDVAAALHLPESEADELLTELARQNSNPVTLDFDDDGHLLYDFTGSDTRWRVLEQEYGAEVDRELEAQRPAESASGPDRFRVR